MVKEEDGGEESDDDDEVWPQGLRAATQTPALQRCPSLLLTRRSLSSAAAILVRAEAKPRGSRWRSPVAVLQGPWVDASVNEQRTALQGHEYDEECDCMRWQCNAR